MMMLLAHGLDLLCLDDLREGRRQGGREAWLKTVLDNVML